MITQFFAEEKGQTLVEYGLLVSLIALACIAILTIFGHHVRDVFVTVNNNLKSVT